MPVFKKPDPLKFTVDTPVEKHYHDHDETWVITHGRVAAYMVDTDGSRQEFELEEGDIWMIETGVEHGCEILTGEAGIFPFAGTIPDGSHEPGHYYMEDDGYIPSLIVVKIPTDRYA